ncbi:MAG: YARHG domain-containing protein [Alphaproteobacteria bacterium]|nr:YARHG domain-containing protein [Alphaproteobacteria bacterium]
MRNWLWMGLALISGQAAADSPDFGACLDRASGDAAVSQCYLDEDARQTARMDAAFTRLLDAQATRHDRQLLSEAQSAWISWRDAQCEWGRALPWGDMPDDLIAPACRMTPTEARADELENLLLFFEASATGPDYLLPDSDKRLLTSDDLAGLSLADLRIARNEIFARHGRRFSDPGLQAWFDARSWYSPRDGEPELNAIETANVALIAAEEARRD